MLHLNWRRLRLGYDLCGCGGFSGAVWLLLLRAGHGTERYQWHRQHNREFYLTHSGAFGANA
jgi:hypothetical protein